MFHAITKLLILNALPKLLFEEKNLRFTFYQSIFSKKNIGLRYIKVIFQGNFAHLLVVIDL
jgi:hypothetical protein